MGSRNFISSPAWVKVGAGSLCALAIVASSLAQASVYAIDKTHTEVGFSVKHLMVTNVKGRFDKFQGSFFFDEKKGELKDVDIKIETASVNTNEADRDKHLRNADFFDAEKFDAISFKSTKVELKDKKPNKVHGNLTIRGVTKPVVLDVVYQGNVMDPWGNEKVAFSATTKINRKDFGVSWQKNLDKGGVVVGDEVTITIEGQGLKTKKNS